jgi:predicted ATP-dependent protease
MKKIKPLKSNEVGLPKFPVKAKDLMRPIEAPLTLYDLSSHERAYEAINFALKMRDMGFHVFVVGEDRSGRMTATLAYLKQYVKKLKPPSDWVYLNNFAEQHSPKPYRLPAGMGLKLKSIMDELISSIRSILIKTFSHTHYLSQVDSMKHELERQIDEEVQSVQRYAQKRGLNIEASVEGFTIVTMKQSEKSKKKKSYTQIDIQEIKDKLNRITNSAHIANRQLAEEMEKTRQSIAAKAIKPLFIKFRDDFYPYLHSWIDELIDDVLNNLDEFVSEEDNRRAEERYAVNLLVDNRHARHPTVYLEPNPTYENLFGSIKYRAMPGGGVETNFTMIRPGALHMANGGILVIRAEYMAQYPEVWEALKAALRDQQIRIEERHREHTLPLMDAPSPKPVPLDLQVFVIGAPIWYYSVFYHDLDFKNYFKIKAEIDPEMPADEKNISVYTRLIRQTALTLTGLMINKEAVQYIMGYSARWVEHRAKLSPKFELMSDLIIEAGARTRDRGGDTISCDDVREMFQERRVRNARLEDRSHEDLEERRILVDTEGAVVGQVNGLTVLSVGDHDFGLPSRITARTYPGKMGVINIERLIHMGGPIQQKGAMILDGYLHGTFSQNFPISCSCSLTFEQNYGGVEGDSASMAELLTILSSLSDLPLRQDIAVTGSMNQFGEVQVVGGVNHKIESFFRLCNHRGLSGHQGVIIPYRNRENVTLRDDIARAINEGKFNIWPVKHIEEAVELMLGHPAGNQTALGFTKDSVYDRVYKTLLKFNETLKNNGNVLK